MPLGKSYASVRDGAACPEQLGSEPVRPVLRVPSRDALLMPLRWNVSFGKEWLHRTKGGGVQRLDAINMHAV